MGPKYWVSSTGRKIFLREIICLNAELMQSAILVPISVSLHKNYHWRIAGFYFFYFAFVGAFAPYWGLYLKSIHFDAVQIAILMSVQPVMRMVAPALWGWLADHSGKRLMVVQIAAL